MPLTIKTPPTPPQKFYLLKNLKAVKKEDLHGLLNEIETKDLYDILDDTGKTFWAFDKIVRDNKLSFPRGLKFNTPLEKYSFTPYFFYETEKDKQGYRDFIDLVFSLNGSNPKYRKMIKILGTLK